MTDSAHQLNEGPSTEVNLESAGQGSGEMFSYSVKAYFTDQGIPLTDADKNNIEALFRRLVHPVGMKLDFEINTTNLLRNID